MRCQSGSVPRDKVWDHARGLALLPRAEYVRMGGIECALGSRRRNPEARMPYRAAVDLLGGIRFDIVHPCFGLHEAALRGEHCGERMEQYCAAGVKGPKSAAKFRARWIKTYGEYELQEATRND